MIEVEKRALVDKTIIKRLINKNFNTKIFSESNRFTLINKNSTDLKIRTTKKDALLTLKTGNWRTEMPKRDYELHFDKNEIGKLIEILKIFGLKNYAYIYLNRKKYLSNEFIFTIEKYQNKKDILLTIAILVNNESEIGTAENTINELLSDEKLSALTAKESLTFLNSVPEIVENTIDFNKIKPEEWQKNYHSYINCEEEIE